MNKIIGLLIACCSLSLSAQAYQELNRSESAVCVAELQTDRGQVINSFRAYDCNEALRACDRGLRNQNQGRIRASCELQAQNYRKEWVQIDEVHFRDGKTAVAIQNCKNARQSDVRCTRSRDHQCGACSEISHSDHSSYLVYQLIGGGGYQPPSRREFVQSFHFRDKKTAVARQKCEQYRSSLPQCSQARAYECTPCTIESHTDHSQFDLYRLNRR